MSAPFTTAPIQDLLATSARAVALGCDASGVCVVSGQSGLGEQTAALDSVLALLVGRPEETSTPTTGSTNGTSSGAPGPSTTRGSSGVSRAGVDMINIYLAGFIAILAGAGLG